MTRILTREDVEKVAVLARLKLTDEELETFTAQLGKVLEYVAILNEVETEGVEPMAHAVEMKNVFREDVPGRSLPRDQALANAPKTDGKFFLVPQILEGA
ncbi:MAG TPA: Asp-tRNA(Asn)/Glu-tRNA(Gln) amidotransferase subunit GatC [Planctomycetaceae bacterium]|nr:Asp-tRNA(Asn)/Glu-tRNA(Gln) amidotransferase subunit GatC [Planctomycetaceae bacterium]